MTTFSITKHLCQHNQIMLASAQARLDKLVEICDNSAEVYVCMRKFVLDKHIFTDTDTQQRIFSALMNFPEGELASVKYCTPESIWNIIECMMEMEDII